jgi:hypothetical protein
LDGEGRPDREHLWKELVALTEASFPEELIGLCLSDDLPAAMKKTRAVFRKRARRALLDKHGQHYRWLASDAIVQQVRRIIGCTPAI